MDSTVMLGQDLAEAVRSVGDRAAADLAARDRKMGNGHGEQCDGRQRAEPASLPMTG